MTESFKRYRLIDLTIFAFLVALFEALAVMSSNSWFSGLAISVSVVPLLITVVMMRWNYFSVIHAMFGGLVYCFGMYIAEGGLTAAQWTSQIVGNAFCLLSMFFLKGVGSDKVKNSVWLSLAFAVIVYLTMQLGRSIVAVVFGESITVFVTFVSLNSISLLLSIVAILCVRKVDGLFENQLSYLTRIEKEKNEKIEAGYEDYTFNSDAEPKNINNDNIEK